MVGQGIHNATFSAGDDFYYDESGKKLGDLTEIGCPTLTQELDNVSYNHSLIHLQSKILAKTIKLFSEIIPVFKICHMLVIRRLSLIHYLDLSTQPNEPEKLLSSNIHLLSPEKWSQFVDLSREKIFLRGQP